MASRLFMLLVQVIVISGVWAALVTLFSPPLTLGWREFYEATLRRWMRNVAVLGIGTALVFGLWLLTQSIRARGSSGVISPPEVGGEPSTWSSQAPPGGVRVQHGEAFADPAVVHAARVVARPSLRGNAAAQVRGGRVERRALSAGRA